MPFHLPSTFVLVFAAFVTTCSAFSPRVILHGLPKAPLLARGTLSAASKFRCPAFLVSHQRSAIGRVRCVAINSVEDVSEDLVPPPLKQNAPSKVRMQLLDSCTGSWSPVDSRSFWTPAYLYIRQSVQGGQKSSSGIASACNLPSLGSGSVPPDRCWHSL